MNRVRLTDSFWEVTSNTPIFFFHQVSKYFEAGWKQLTPRLPFVYLAYVSQCLDIDIPMEHSFSCLGYIVPLLGAKRNRYLVFHKSHRHLSAFNNNKHTDLASWKSDKSTYFVNSLLFFFSFISSLERFSQFSYLVKTTVIAVVLQTNQIQHRMNEWCRHTAVNNLAKFL